MGKSINYFYGYVQVRKLLVITRPGNQKLIPILSGFYPIFYGDLDIIHPYFWYVSQAGSMFIPCVHPMFIPLEANSPGSVHKVLARVLEAAAGSSDNG